MQFGAKGLKPTEIPQIWFFNKQLTFSIIRSFSFTDFI